MMTDQTPLQRLYRVQELDLSLDHLREEEGQFPDALRAARAEQDRLNNELEETEINLESVEKVLRQTELDLSSMREQIARAKEEQEKNAFDARAQSQFGSRIQMLEERAEELEEDLVPLREKQQTLSGHASDLRSQHRAQRPQLAELEAQDDQRIEALRAQGQASRDERSVLMATLDSRTAKEYEQIRKAKKGQGLAEVKNGRCSACNVVLPVNVQQKVAQGKLPPVKCPSCGRFLIRLDV